MEHEDHSEIRRGTKYKGVELNCLAFPDDMALLSETWEDTKEQILELSKNGPQILIENTKIINRKPPKAEERKI